MEVIGVAALVGLRAFYCGHERVRDGRVVVGGGVVVRGRGAVEGDGEAEVEGLELEAWGVRAVSGAGDALRGFAEAVEKRREGALPVELSGLRVVCIAEEVASGDAEVVGRRVREIGNLAEQCVGPGVVVSFGDLKGFVSDDEEGGGEGQSLRGVVGELAKLLQVHYDKFWLMGAAASYDNYLNLVGKFPSIEKDWDLQLLPITLIC